MLPADVDPPIGWPPQIGRSAEANDLYPREAQMDQERHAKIVEEMRSMQRSAIGNILREHLRPLVYDDKLLPTTEALTDRFILTADGDGFHALGTESGACPMRTLVDALHEPAFRPALREDVLFVSRHTALLQVTGQG